MRHLIYIITVLTLGLTSLLVFGTQETEAKASLSFAPGKVLQGEPLQVVVKGTRKSDIVTVTIGSSTIPMTEYNNVLIGFIPIDINRKPGMYEVKASVKDTRKSANAGTKVMTKLMEVIEREKYQAPLGIPDKLGGNTAVSQKELVNTLAVENQTLLNLGSAKKALWKKAFIFPVTNPIVTDPYGYSRMTGAYTITHKGTDFRAPVGTELYAVNDGVVKLAQLGRNYGNTIAIDHGLGVMSFYMHLSEMNVKAGDKVKRGELIGLAGMTGYAEAAHLHFTLRINDISIDPIVFFGFFK